MKLLHLTTSPPLISVLCCEGDRKNCGSSADVAMETMGAHCSFAEYKGQGLNVERQDSKYMSIT